MKVGFILQILKIVILARKFKYLSRKQRTFGLKLVKIFGGKIQHNFEFWRENSKLKVQTYSGQSFGQLRHGLVEGQVLEQFDPGQENSDCHHI